MTGGKPHFHFDRHVPEYRDHFTAVTREMHRRCPIAWTDTYDGHWVAAGSDAVFELARCPHVSNDHDVNGERRGYKGISIPRRAWRRAAQQQRTLDDAAISRSIRGDDR